MATGQGDGGKGYTVTKQVFREEEPGTDSVDNPSLQHRRTAVFTYDGETRWWTTYRDTRVGVTDRA